MKLIRAYKGQLLLTLLIFFMILAAPFQDYTERVFLCDEMNYPEDLLGIVTNDKGILNIPEGSGTFSLTSNLCFLKRGSYQVSFSLASQTKENTVDVYEPLYLNSDNTTGRVLTEAKLTPGQTTVTLNFNVDAKLSRVQFRVHTTGDTKFESVYLISEKGLYKDPYIYAGLLLLGSALLLIYRMRRKVRPEVLLVLGFAALWSSIPLTLPWLYYGHDMFFHYSRLFQLTQEIASEALPVRIHTDLFRGFGYMSPVFYAETFLYPFALLGAVGLSPIGCYRLLLFCVNLATAGVAYYSFSRLCHSRRLGLITTFLYTLAFYRMINLYTRSAVGEVLATIFLPLLLLGMYQLFYGDSRKWLTASLAFTGLFQSHMITTELSVGFSVLFGLLSIRRLKDKKRLIHLLLAAGTTLLLNLWSLIPMLDLMRYPIAVFGDTRSLAGYSLYAIQVFDTGLNNASGGADGRGSISGEMSYSIGLLLLIGCLLFVALCFRKKQKLPTFHKKLGLWCLFLGSLSVYASTIYFPWERLQRIGIIYKLAGSIQFPFRFLPFATVFLCVTSALAIYYFFRERAAKQLLFLGCAFFLTWSAGAYFSNFTNDSDTYASWEDQLDYTDDSDSLYVVTDNQSPFSHGDLVEQPVTLTPSEGISFTNVTKDGTNLSFSYTNSSEQGAWVDVPLNYYPWYQAVDENGEALTTSLSTETLRLRVELPESSSGSVTVRFQIPVYCRIGDAVSLLTVAALATLAVISVRRRKLDSVHEPEPKETLNGH